MQSDDTEFVVRLFAEAVPEIAAGIVEIKAIGRLPGVRSKLALYSRDPKVDSVGVCVGTRGFRIKNVIDQLHGERIDLFRWDESPEKLIASALQPAQIERVVFHPERHVAEVIVKESQVSLALGRRGTNRELASRLTGWIIHVVSMNPPNESDDGIWL
ncbi:MAG: hypothetical protein JNM56_30940 [Planctomycetia bacterium]|nr:hypothetical protein [Planctomycetia bacterium]